MNDLEHIKKNAGILTESARDNAGDVRLTWSVKPYDPSMALLSLNASKIPLGEVSAADYKDDEQRGLMEDFIRNELQRVAKRLTKKFGY